MVTHPFPSWIILTLSTLADSTINIISLILTCVFIKFFMKKTEPGAYCSTLGWFFFLSGKKCLIQLENQLRELIRMFFTWNFKYSHLSSDHRLLFLTTFPLGSWWFCVGNCWLLLLFSKQELTLKMDACEYH